MPCLPKLSYVLLSHNREQYIRQALESAFAQDYEGELEYIISDDCSTDRTYAIINECVKAYSGGRRVVVTQTPRNLHLAGNTNHAMQFVESDWVVRADDDDISCVDRCSIIGKAIADHPAASMIFARFSTFTDAEETSVLEQSRQQRTHLYPAREVNPSSLFSIKNALHMTWSVQWFRHFGPLPINAYWVDDLIMYYRCWCLGTAVDTENCLVHVRNGSGNMSRGQDDGQRGLRAIMRTERFHEQYHTITSAPLQQELERLRAYDREHPELRERMHPLLQDLERAIDERLTLSDYWRTSCLGRYRIRKKMGYTGLFSLLRCLPLPLFAALLSTYRLLLKK